MENNPDKILDIVKKFKDRKILVLGDLMLDEYIFGTVERISPEAPVPILDLKKTSFTVGGAANAANNIKSLGAGVMLFGVTGSDEKGETLRNALISAGIGLEGVIIEEGRKTTVKTRVIARDQHVIRIDSEDRNPILAETESKIVEMVKKEINNFDAVLISDYAKGMITQSLSRSIINLAKENNIFCMIDPKGNDYSKYTGCNIITPNKKELAQSLNLQPYQLESEDDLIQAARTLISKISCDNVLVTRGSEGMTLFAKNGDIVNHSAIEKKVIDVSGAGDTAIAAFALSYSSGATAEEAIMIASFACGSVIGKVGTACVSCEELKNELINGITRS